MIWCAFADPVFADRSSKSGEQAFLLYVLVVHCSGNSHCVSHGGFAFQSEVSQYVLHQRLVDQAVSEGATVAAVVRSLSEGLAHTGRTANHAVKAGHGNHFDNGWYTTAFFANHPCQRAP